jgi:hypothetical protein
LKSAIEKLDAVTYRLDFELDPMEIFGKVSQRVAEMAATVQLPGFRPGKSKRAAIERLIGPQLRQEVIEGLLVETFQREIQSFNLDVIGEPEFDWDCEAVNEGRSMRFSAQFETYPSFDLKSFQDIELSVPFCALDIEDFRKELDRLRWKFIQWTAVKKVEVEGSRVIIDISYLQGARVLGRRRRIELLLTEAGVQALDLLDQRLAEEIASELSACKVGDSLLVLKTPDVLRAMAPVRFADLDGLRVFVTKVLARRFIEDDRELLMLAGFGGIQGVDPWNEFRQSVVERIQGGATLVFFNRLMRKILSHQEIVIPNRICEETFQVDLLLSDRSLRRVKSDPVAREISELLIRNESRERLMLEIFMHGVEGHPAVGDRREPQHLLIDAVPTLIHWVEEHCRLIPMPVSREQLETEQANCSEFVRRLVRPHQTLLVSLIQRKSAVN